MTLEIETSAVVGVAHPLDPLSREEISRAVAVLREGPSASVIPATYILFV